MSTVTIDKAGRVVLPKSLRDELNLSPGDSLELESDGEKVMLRPVRPQSRMQKERGLWVFQSGANISAALTDQVLENLREGRSRRENRGSLK